MEDARAGHFRKVCYLFLVTTTLKMFKGIVYPLKKSEFNLSDTPLLLLAGLNGEVCKPSYWVA